MLEGRRIITIGARDERTNDLMGRIITELNQQLAEQQVPGVDYGPPHVEISQPVNGNVTIRVTQEPLRRAYVSPLTYAEIREARDRMWRGRDSVDAMRAAFGTDILNGGTIYPHQSHWLTQLLGEFEGAPRPHGQPTLHSTWR